MKLSTRARYALRAMMVMAQKNESNKPISLGEVADRTEVSRRYLEQIFISLKNANLLKAFPGKKGGHLLTRPAEEIGLVEIVEAAIGPINVVDCVLHPEVCMMADWCQCRSLYFLLNRRIKDTLNSFTLADLAENRVGDAVEQKLAAEGSRRAE